MINTKNRLIITKCFLLMLILLTVINVSYGASPARIQVGDAINITVSGHPEFSRSVMVFQDGTTDYPLLAGIPVDGLTAMEVKDLLKPVMLRYDLEPEIFVIISQTRTIGFQIYGEIARPGQYTIQGTLNLQQAIAMAGGLTVKGDYRRINVFRDTDYKRSTILIDFEDYFHPDSLFIAPEIQPGDVIVIPRTEWENNVRIFGNVQQPGIYILSPEDNILSIVYKAGGFLENSDQKRIIHIKQKDGYSERFVYNLKKIAKQSDYSDIPLVGPGDIIIVQKTDEWRSLWYWTKNIREILYIATAILLLYIRY